MGGYAIARLDEIDELVHQGYRYRADARADADFDAVRDEPAFRALITS